MNATAKEGSATEEIEIVMEAERPPSAESPVESTSLNANKPATTASSDSSGGDDSAKENKDAINKAKKKGMGWSRFMRLCLIYQLDAAIIQ